MSSPRHVLSTLAAVLGSSLLVFACHDRDTVSGPSPTPTPTPIPLDGRWVGGFVHDAPLVLCATVGGGTAEAVLTENGSSLSGEITWHVGYCDDRATIQAIRTGDAIIGTATQGGIGDLLTGRLERSELSLVIARPPAGGFTAGRAILHRP